MRTYAEYLNSLTVKELHSIARQGGYSRYSKLRKAELVAFIDGENVIDWDGAEQTHRGSVAHMNNNEVTDATALNLINVGTGGDTYSVTYGRTLGEAWMTESAGWYAPAEKIVVMTCCGERYGSVKDTLNHTCPIKAAPVSFSHTPVKATESAPKATEAVEVEQTTAEDLKYAYQAMRASLHKARGLTHAKIAARMRAISAQLRGMGVNMRTV